MVETINNNKTFFAPIPNTGSIKNNIYDQCRSEGRFAINIASGLSKIDYNSYVQSIYRHWSNQNINPTFEINNNINFIPDYTLLFTWWDYLKNNIESKVKIYMCNGTDQAEQVFSRDYLREQDIFCTASKKCFNEFSKVNNSKQWVYFPTVFPIPEYSLDFLPFTKIENNNFIKIYVQVACFGTDIHEWQPKLIFDTCKSLFELGYKIELNLQTHFINKFNIQDYNNINCSINFISNIIDYQELYKNILYNDLMLCFVDSGGAGGSQYDFISLGKPTIFFSPGAPGKYFITSYYYAEENMFTHNGNHNYFDLKKYIEWFLINQEEIYNKYKECINDYRFPVWKEHMLKILV